MDPVGTEELLRDLHFDLGSTENLENVKPRNLENRVVLEREDRPKMIAKWVSDVQSHHRSMSHDSFFEVNSVCTKLKRSFLKPKEITETDLEDLRLKFVSLGVQDSSSNHVDSQSSAAEQGDMINSKLSGFHTDRKRPQLRYRSRTVPLPFDVGNLVSAKRKESSFTSGVLQNYTVQNIAPLHSIDLQGNVDVNHNLTTCTDAANASKCPASENVAKRSFRLESLYPSSSELKGSKQIFKSISPNKIKDCYESEEDYLRTQFYLLRGDFMIPLIEGIRDYKKQLRKGMKPEDGRNLNLHHSVFIKEHCFFDNKLGIAIDMGFPLPEQIGEKNFMDGSLVLITPNHFKDIYIGTVLFRKFCLRDVLPTKSRRKSNILLVQLHGASHFNGTLQYRKVLLAESQAFFQPYHHIMKILQGMSLGDLPLKEYIIDTYSPERILHPSYLGKDTKYILDGKFNVDVLYDPTWPKARDLNLNDSQLDALKEALSKKLVLIQGPPGTGKTYLGSKVATALLQNRQIWSPNGSQPMLLMCQTNHALDQFMELLLPVSKNIMRVGSQSKSCLLTGYTLKVWLSKGRKTFKQHPEIEVQRSKVNLLRSTMMECRIECSRLMSYGIVDFFTFVGMGLVDLKHAKCISSSEHYLMWLEDAKFCQVSHKNARSQECSKKTTIEKSCREHAIQPNHTICEMDSVSGPGELQNKSESSKEDCDSLKWKPGKAISIKYVINLENLKKEESTRVTTDGSKAKITEKLKFYQDRLAIKRGGNHCDTTSQCLWDITPCNRWAQYRFWINKLEITLKSHLEKLEIQYQSAVLAFDDLCHVKKLEAMRRVELVGMTTSAAARLYPVLQKLQCPIVIVEEAAEVLESHIVATVTKHCQHLILLGDHKQLRPRPACYSLSRTHFTDVSLFERLALNNTVKVNTLLTQHRMRPEISMLIRPCIYKELYDHDCTKDRGNIHGMKDNVFFFSHSWQELKDDATGSYYNQQEARMAVQLGRFLLHEKYKSNEICILAAYRQQVYQMEKERSLYDELSELRILTIDNFQGEEAKIIILSLVRNNSDGQIGFLKTENRVCVALSRARDGLFILGNIHMLSSCSELWQSVYESLQKRGSVGQSFLLNCPRHSITQKEVFQPDDLAMYIEQGCCQKKCTFKLQCGHCCKRRCHKYDASHPQYRCNAACKKKCAYGHRCKRKCSEKCGNCESIVLKTLSCGHKATMKCSVDLSNHLCGVIVKKCMEPCSHWVNLQCWMPAKSQKYCPYQCPEKLKCGHRCPLRCSSCHNTVHDKIKCKCEGLNRLHSKFKRSVPSSHIF